MNKIEEIKEKSRDKVRKAKQFLDLLVQKGIVHRSKYKGGFYQCQGSHAYYDFELEIILLDYTLCYSYYRGDSTKGIITFDRFFELLHPEVKKHFAYHLDLFQDF